jgi:hypothetical protein
MGQPLVCNGYTEGNTVSQPVTPRPPCLPVSTLTTQPFVREVTSLHGYHHMVVHPGYDRAWFVRDVRNWF